MNTINNELLANVSILDEEQLIQFREWLLAILKQGPVIVTFNKKDGSERVMTCTLDPSVLPPAPVHESNTDSPVNFPKTKKENLNTVSVYDLTAMGWRSFILKNVTNVTLTIQ